MTAASIGAVACDPATETNPDGPGSDTGSGGVDDDILNEGVGDGNVGNGDPWAAMPLLDDTSNPDRVVSHASNDIVTGIYFETPDKGFIVTRDDGLQNTRGGAAFHATAATVTSIAFSGDNTGIRHGGTIDFIGLERSPTGYIAIAYASEVIASNDGGATFQLAGNSSASRFGVEQVLANQVSASGTTLVRNNGVVSTSASAPGPDATYVDIWQSSSSVPATMCREGPRDATSPTMRYSVYVRPDRSVLAYTANLGDEPTLCISTDGGHTFLARPLDVPASTAAAIPTGVLFTSRMKGFAWFAAFNAGAYLKRTVDGGVTWTGVALPAELAGHQIELPAAFFTRGGGHGWLVGYDNTGDGQALLLASSDAGATWSVVPGFAAAVAAAHGDRLYSGFALDTAHIWVGGAKGLVIHN